MNEGKNYELELSEETEKKLEAVAKKIGRSEEEICQYIFLEFLEKQAKIMEKKAEETGKPVNELINMHFNKILDYLAAKKDR